MMWFRKLMLMLPFARRERERILEQELQSYLEMAEDEARNNGLSPEDARLAAQRDFGNILRSKEAVRAEWVPQRIEQIVQDLRYAIRSLGKAPLFTTVAVLSLALGIGSANAVFSLVNGILLKPLAYRDSGQLVYVREVVPSLSHLYPTLPVNMQHFLYWHEHARTFASMTALRSTRSTLTGSGEPEQIGGVETSADLFRVLGTNMAQGRGFLPGEDQPGKRGVVIISDSLWKRRFHSMPTVVGQNINLDGTPTTIVGVLPPDFTFPAGSDLGALSALQKRTDIFLPIRSAENGWDGDFDYIVIGRLRNGTSLRQGLAELSVLTKQLSTAHQAESKPYPVAQPLQSAMGETVKTSLVMLLAAVMVLLMIVCVNLANLMLARAHSRVREFSIRAALGADRRRLLQQMLTEASLLALMGGASGVLLSLLAIRLFVVSTTIPIPRLNEVHVDGAVMLFSLFVTVACACLFGVVPAYRVARTDLQEAMRASGPAVTASKQSLRIREVLVGCEVALSTVLVLLAGLLISSLLHLMSTDKGFQEERAIAMDLSLPETQYTSPAARNQFFERALSALRAVPGVMSAALIDSLPLTGESQVNGIEPTGSGGSLDPISRTPIMINVRFVSPAYFETIGIPRVSGRTFDQQDLRRHVAVVSARLAARVWPGQNPLGKKFRTGSGVDQVEVVGVVRDTYNGRLDESPTLIAYVPYSIRTPNYGSLVVRTSAEPEALIRAMRHTIASLDPSLPLSEVRTISELVDAALARRRFQMRLAAAFGAGALLLSLIGIYGVVAYNVEQRRGELGLRLALGARGTELMALMMKRGLWPVFIGLGCGLFVSVGLAGLVSGLVFGVTATDPATLAGVVVILGLTAFVACFLPASRAARMDPAVILRHQ